MPGRNCQGGRARFAGRVSAALCGCAAADRFCRRKTRRAGVLMRREARRGLELAGAQLPGRPRPFCALRFRGALWMRGRGPLLRAQDAPRRRFDAAGSAARVGICRGAIARAPRPFCGPRSRGAFCFRGRRPLLRAQDAPRRRFDAAGSAAKVGICRDAIARAPRPFCALRFRGAFCFRGQKKRTNTRFHRQPVSKVLPPGDRMRRGAGALPEKEKQRQTLLSSTKALSFAGQSRAGAMEARRALESARAVRGAVFTHPRPGGAAIFPC